VPDAAQGPVVLPITADVDVTRARHLVRDLAVAAGFDLVTQTKVVTATSELARNVLIHGGGGQMSVERIERGGTPGLRAVFTDSGPGIPDLEKALTEGWTSGKGLGLGLSGSRRLVSEFELESRPGEGTRVCVVVWGRTR
jgi:serine/threonine-protein kinase RsbT